MLKHRPSRLAVPAAANMITEAVSYQGRSPLFIEICAIVKKVKEMPEKSIKANSLESLGFGAAVGRYTGVKTRIKVSDSIEVNAWIETPYLDANQAVLDDLRRESFWCLDHVNSENMKAFGNTECLNGTVDRAKSKVTGDFSAMACPMEITRGLLLHKDATPEMITAVLLHEIGHVFTYFEFYGRMTTFNGALQAAMEQFVGANTREDRIKIIQDLDGKFGVNTPDVDGLADTRDRGVFVTTYARNYLVDRGSALGSTMYDLTLWESLADQFAMRHGAGADGVRAMELLYNHWSVSSRQSWLMHIVMTLLKSLLWFVVAAYAIWSISIGLLAPLILLLFIDPTKRIYDEPRGRMDRMRRDMVSAFKDPTLNKEAKDKLVDDIKVADDVLAQFKDKAGLIEMFYTSILPNGRRQTSQRKFQLDLEKLTANELLVAGGRLGQLLAK